MAGVVRAAALTRVAKSTPGVEPGVTGKERRWQQNRQFGPGAFVPYKNTAVGRPKPAAPRPYRVHPIPNTTSTPKRASA